MSDDSATGHGAPRTVVVKVGGSLVSDKRSDHDIDEAAVLDYARLVADLARSYPGRVVLVAGGGALGHGAVRRKEHDGRLALLPLTRATFAVKWVWTEAFRAVGLPAVPLQAMAMYAEGGDGPMFQTGVVSRLLGTGVLPVLSGDCVLTADGDLRILGSDHVPGILLDGSFGPVRVVALTDVPGIHAGRTGDSPVVPYLDAADPSRAYAYLWPTAAWDTSGAMRGKVDAFVAHAARGAECVIARGDRKAASLRHLMAPMADWPKDLPRTVISRSRPA
ncbi:hypothetical protein AB0420_20580 [Streptomyces caelestis]|uniref:Aspartate/glutamate/uridylate kinase domain-containing protein n=1 Tax=Streptomyces heliomycini TaxID=284032 RepID=A0ABV5L5Q7_9ACTN|nr:hypothetical protein [Streptomyces sp. XY152]KOV24012.1 hypothetical protein ADK58_22340 [Streptomyces sp. XY152]